MINNDEIPPKKYLCPDHVILAGRQIMNSVLTFEYLLLLSFLTMALQLGAPSRYYYMGALTQKR